MTIIQALLKYEITYGYTNLIYFNLHYPVLNSTHNCEFGLVYKNVLIPNHLIFNDNYTIDASLLEETIQNIDLLTDDLYTLIK